MIKKAAPPDATQAHTNIIKLMHMASEEINKYINTRYDRWLDYAKYHASLAGIGSEAIDILNEVMAMLLEKDSKFLQELYDKKKGRYRELDFFVLQMIKLNATSDTSPYRHKYKPIPSDNNIDWRKLDIIDEEDSELDSSDYICTKMHEVREILEDLHLSDKVIRIFSWKFFSGESYSSWPGPESKKELYDIYKKVFNLILSKLKGNILI